MLRQLRGWLTRRTDDPLPLALTFGGVVLSAACLAAGLVVDTAGMGVNLLASLAVVGPALVLSNVVVAQAQKWRKLHRAEMDVALVTLLLWNSIDVAGDCLRILHVDAVLNSTPPPGDENFASVDYLRRSIEMAQAAVDAAIETPGFEAKSADLEIVGENMAMPAFAAIERFVERLDRESPCPNAVISAVGAGDWAKRVSIDFVYRPSQPSRYRSREEQPEIWEPETGVYEIGTMFDRATNGSRPGLGVGAMSYFHFVDGALQRSLWLAEALLRDLPEEVTVGGSQ